MKYIIAFDFTLWKQFVDFPSSPKGSKFLYREGGGTGLLVHKLNLEDTL